MSKENSENLLYDWKIVILIFAVGLAVWTIQPNFSEGTNNIRLGLDLSGGSRAVLTPNGTVTQETIDSAIQVMQERINAYGVKDISIRSTSDLFGNRFVMVEAAGTTEEDIKELLAKQGKFDAKIGNDTVFTGSDIFPEGARGGVRTADGGTFVFELPIRIQSFPAQQRFANLTAGLSVVGESLSAPLDLYLDDQLVDSLQIASDLQGRIVDSASISGPATTREEAAKKKGRMEAILKTGALPIKLDLTSIDSISPRLGHSFIDQISVASIACLVAVGALLFLYYRNALVVATMLGMSVCAAVIVLGLGASTLPVIGGWQLDLASIAGLIVALAVGVNQQIIITDQVLKGELGEEVKKSLVAKLKEVGGIIIASFGTTLAAMIPLMLTHLGALRGFAITTILGEAVAFFITRPAFLKVVPKIIKE